MPQRDHPFDFTTNPLDVDVRLAFYRYDPDAPPGPIAAEYYYTEDLPIGDAVCSDRSFLIERDDGRIFHRARKSQWDGNENFKYIFLVLRWEEDLGRWVHREYNAERTDRGTVVFYFGGERGGFEQFQHMEW